MANITLDYFEVMEIWGGEGSLETISGESITSERKGKFLRVDATSGKAVYGNASSSGEVAILHGLAMTNQKHAGDAVTLLRYGLVDVGDELDALDYGAAVYLSDTDGLLSTTAGTVSTVAGRVWPVAEHDGTIRKKLMIDLR